MTYKSANKIINTIALWIGLLLFTILLFFTAVQTLEVNNFAHKIINGIYSFIILIFIVLIIRKYYSNVTAVVIEGDKLTYKYMFNLSKRTIDSADVLAINKMKITHFNYWNISILSTREYEAYVIILKNENSIRLVEYNFINYSELLRKVNKFKKQTHTS